MTQAPATNRAGRRFGVAALALGFIAGAVWWYLHRAPAPSSDPSAGGVSSFPLPEVSSSPFLNTAAHVAYVGSEACRACHLGHEASFHRTGMGRSMDLVDLEREPPDGAYDHPKSKRRYEVLRKGGAIWHRELLLSGSTEEIVLAEYPVKWVVGSGRHSLTYLVETDGFLVESPITWYTSKKAWGMSPGYDRPNHSSFERAVGENCLICHAGRAEAVGGSLHRMDIKEATIGCERCHGPGELHVAKHRPAGLGEVLPTANVDHTIVNPVHLPRHLAEAICQQCHLRSDASIVARGRKVADYRPGLPLEDFRHDFRLSSPSAAMTVVGHVEQMHLSKCYQASETMSCLACHDPHNEPRPTQRERHYKSVCLSCHEPAACKVDAAVQRKESPSNNCVHCHMPTSPTEIPHLAFTHHRIGVHDAAAKPAPQESPVAGTLTPFFDLSRWSEVDRQRSLGLGYMEAAHMAKRADLAEEYRVRALKLLTAVRDQGLRDPALDANLARLRFDLELDGVRPLAESALAGTPADPQDRCNALFLIADALAAEGKRKEAIPYLRELTTLRRHSTQMLLLADCERAAGDPGHVATLETAVRIDPRRWQVHQYLAEHYHSRGEPTRAEHHRKRAVP
jgi:predicted CXXCH cytochrome family protein